MSSKTVLVFTATGLQGGSVTRYMRKAGWEVIAVTRNPDSDSAKPLKEIGAKVVKGDLNDPESYKEYYKGIDAVFVNTDFWSMYFSNGFDSQAAFEGEMKQSKAAIQGAYDAGVNHIVFSSLDLGRDLVPHSDSKLFVTEWAAQKNIVMTNVYTSFYYTNLVKFGMMQANEDGTFTMTIPLPDHSDMIAYAPEQTGAWVKVALENPEEWKGKSMTATAERITIAEWAKTLSEVSGKQVKSIGIDDATFHDEGFKSKIGLEMWLNMKAFYENLPSWEVRDIKTSLKIAPEAWTLKQWAEQSAELKQVLKF